MPLDKTAIEISSPASFDVNDHGDKRAELGKGERIYYNIEAYKIFC